MLLRLFETDADWSMAVVRIILGVIFFAHGAQKMLGWFGGDGFRGTMQALTGFVKLPAALAFLVITGEFFAGTALIVGLLSRVAALAVLAIMAGAIAKVHLANGLFIDWYGSKKGHGFEFHLLAMALALVLLIRGAGALSLDRILYEHPIRQEVIASPLLEQ